MENAKAVSTALAQQFKLSAQDSSNTDELESTGENYSIVIVSLMYLMVCTRSNLDHYSSQVSRYMGNSRKAHWEATKWY